MHFTFSPGSKFLGSFISHYDPKYKDDGNIIIFSEKNNPLIKPTPRHRKKKTMYKWKVWHIILKYQCLAPKKPRYHKEKDKILAYLDYEYTWELRKSNYMDE